LVSGAKLGEAGSERPELEVPTDWLLLLDGAEVGRVAVGVERDVADFSSAIVSESFPIG